MGIGPKLYALFPGLFERVAGKSLVKIGDFHMEISYFIPLMGSKTLKIQRKQRS